MNKELKEMIQADLNNIPAKLALAKKQNNKQYAPILYAELMGKYSHLQGFPKLQDNTIMLQAYPNIYNENVTRILGYLQTYILQNESQENDTHKQLKNSNIDFSKVFIVHGHNGELKEAVARIIEKQGIKPIILSEQANQGKTIIEKIEKCSDVGAAICLFTNDDLGKENSKSDLNPRARQNVVFEAGYFMGLLGRDHVVMIADSDNEIPSDLSGMVYTSSVNWKLDLCKDLKAMGYSIDFNTLF